MTDEAGKMEDERERLREAIAEIVDRHICIGGMRADADEAADEIMRVLPPQPPMTDATDEMRPLWGAVERVNDWLKRGNPRYYGANGGSR